MDINKKQPKTSSSFWGSLKDKLSGEEKNQFKADDFSNEKNVIAKYQTATKGEAEIRKTIKTSSAPIKPPVDSSLEPGFEVKKEPAKPLTPKPIPKPSPPELVTSFKKKPELSESVKTIVSSKSDQTKNIKPKKLGLSGVAKVSYSPNKWQAPKILKTNLIKGEVTTFVSWSKYSNIAVMAIGLSILIIAVLFFGLSYWETVANQEGESLVSEIKDLDMRINVLREETKEIDQFQRKLNLATKLLNNHIYWTKFFAVLEDIVISEARITNSFQGSLTGEYDFSIEVNSFESIYNQLRVLRSHEAVISAAVDSGSFVASGYDKKAEKESDAKVEFKLKLDLSPDIFFNKKINEAK